jgi:hypothetical protein
VTTAGAKALLTGLIDYAGLFPPAGLGMEESVAEYARQRQGPEAWMLGRYVVPAGRLVELEGAAVGHLKDAGAGEPWRLSALLGADVAGDAAAATAFNDRNRGCAVVDAVELRASTAAEVDRSLPVLPAGLTVFVELPLAGNLEGLLGALRAGGARAKVRTGGVVSDAIPDPADLAGFLEACARAGVPFKATAGLHHAVRAERSLTYAPHSPRATLHGFLNVFAAAAFARAGVAAEGLEAVLREGDARAFTLDDAGLAWRGRRVSAADLRAAREGFACSFGSCSFAEPVAELQGMGVVA